MPCDSCDSYCDTLDPDTRDTLLTPSVFPAPSDDTEAAIFTCRAPPLPVTAVPLRCSLPVTMRTHHHRSYDPPPAYHLSVIAEEPPSYETACSDEQLDKLGRNGPTEGVS